MEIKQETLRGIFFSAIDQQESLGLFGGMFVDAASREIKKKGVKLKKDQELMVMKFTDEDKKEFAVVINSTDEKEFAVATIFNYWNDPKKVNGVSVPNIKYKFIGMLNL